MNWTPSTSQEAASIFDSLNQAYVRLDREFRYTFVNRAAERHLGKDRAELLGKALWEVYPALVGTPFEEHYRRAMAERVTVTFEDCYQPWQRWYAITATPDPDGGIVIHFADIAERKQAEEAVDRQVRLNRLLLDSMPCVALLLEPRTRRIVASNEAAVRAGAVPGKTCFESWANRAAPCPWCLAPRLWATGTPQSCEPEHLGIRWEAHWAPVSDDLYLHYAFDITERKRAEEALRESEERHRTILGTAMDGFWLADTEGRLLEVNEAYCRMSGYSAGELLAMRVPDLEAAERDVDTAAHIQRVMARGEDRFESRHRRKDGSVFDVEISVQYRPADGGRFVSFLRDITERKKAEEALVQSHDLLSNLARLVPGVVYQYRLYPDGRSAFPYSSTGMNDIYEVTPEEVREDATPVFGRLHPDDYGRIVDSIQESARTLQPFYCEFRVILPRQGLRWRWCQAQPERTADGGVLWHGIISDITERKRIEEALRESEARYRLLVETSGEAIFLTAEDGAILSANPEACRMLGRSEAEICQVGRHGVVDLNDPRLAPALAERERTGRFAGELNFVRKDGTVFPAEISVVAFKDSAGRSRASTFMRDIGARKRAEERLRESEDRYRNLFDQSGDPILLLELGDGPPLILDANQAALRAHGYSRQEMVGQPISLLEPGITREDIEERTRLLAEGKPMYIRHRRKDGSVFDVESVARRVQTGARDVVLAVERDITERKRAEEALRASEERFRRTFQHSAAGMALVSPDFRFLQVNGAFCKMLGYAESELLGKSFQDVTLPEDRPVGRELAHQALSGETEMFHLEKRYLHQDGTVVWGLVSSTLVRDTENKPLHFVTQIQDITERKRAEQALRRERMMLARTESIAHVGSWEWDVATDTATWSEELFRIFQRDPREGAPSFADQARFFHPDEMARLRQTVEAAVAEGTPYELELRAIRKDGQIRVCAASGAAEMTPGGRAVRLFGSLQDITERKQTEEEKENLTAQLAQAQKMETIGRLAGGVAHDFNNLLTIINGYSALALLQTKPEDSQFQRLTEILRAGERAAALVGQLLAFSRRQALEPEALSLNATVGEMEKMLGRLVGEEVEIVLKLDPAVAPVLADRHQIEQVIMNLAVNARDAMPGGGTLTLETGERHLEGVCESCHEQILPGTYVELTVRDTGMGMDEHTLEHLFEPFFTTKEVGKGTGLGLSTVQGIVNQSGGHVGVESEVGKGTAFHVYLPVAGRPAAEPSPPPPADAEGGAETILLVEDHQEVRQFIATILEEYGYRVRQAQDAEEALRVFAAQPVDLLLTDVVMPKMSGVELARHARLTMPGLRTLFISGYSEETHEREWESLGGESFLQKPFTPKALADKVREVLEGSRGAASAPPG